MLLKNSVVLTEENNVMVNDEELNVTTEYLTLQTTRRVNLCCYSGVRLHTYIYKWLCSLCGQNSAFLNVEVDGVHNYHSI